MLVLNDKLPLLQIYNTKAEILKKKKDRKMKQWHAKARKFIEDFKKVMQVRLKSDFTLASFSDVREDFNP